MPRITKAQLEQQVADLQGELANVRHDLRVEKVLLIGADGALQMMHNRIDRLEKENEDMKKENEDLKNRVRRGCDRSRSPRRPTTSSQASMDTTCKAFAQVSLWQRDNVVQEQRGEIQRLQAEVASLRRGEGPIGEVLAHIDALENARINNTPPPDQAAWLADTLARQTRPVHEVLISLRGAHLAMEKTLRWGGPLVAATIPTRQP